MCRVLRPNEVQSESEQKTAAAPPGSAGLTPAPSRPPQSETPPPTVVSLSLQLERSYQRFTAFYASRHSGRKLTWLYHLSKGELVTNCFKNRYAAPCRRWSSQQQLHPHAVWSQIRRTVVTTHLAVVSRYTLQASTFQMAILLQYNTEDSYTVQQLTDSTQIKTVSTIDRRRVFNEKS